jgi:hypothetical protein
VECRLLASSTDIDERTRGDGRLCALMAQTKLVLEQEKQ